MSLQYCQRRVRRMLLWQLLTSLVLMGLALILAGWPGLKSACLAGVIYWLPYICCMRLTFRHQGARAAQQIVRSFYQGEALKIGLSIILFTLIFAFFNLVPWVFFSVYMSMQLMMWLMLVIIK